ncbi:MAG: diguanylate cyclase, partial [Helicobacteraceae bacterium]|nr:diguanylate cyclase [Helicobacteraceae bacterium]
MGLFSKLVGGEYELTLFIAFLQHVSVPFSLTRAEDGSFIEVNEAFSGLYKLSKEDILKHNSRSLAIWQNTEERNKFLEELYAAPRYTKTFSLCTYIGGQKRMFDLRANAVRLDNQQYIIGYFADMTSKYLLELELRYSEERFINMSNTMQDSFIHCDADANILQANRACILLTGYSEDELLSMKLSDLEPEGVYEKDYGYVKKQLDTIGYTSIYERELIRHNKTVIHTWLRTFKYKSEDAKKIGFWIVGNELKELGRVENNIDYLTYHDTLTELPNQAWLIERVDRIIKRARRTNEQIALLFIDIDRFGAYNDIYGYSFGNLLLCEIAHRVEGILRASDQLVRIDSDVFAIAIASHQAADSALSIIRRLHNTFIASIELQSEQINVSVSIGVSLFPQDSLSPDDLFSNAKSALLKAKHRSKNSFSFFSASCDSAAHEQMALETALASALKSENIFVEFQPLLALSSGKTVSFEALVRWRQPSSAVLSADRFISIATNIGIIADIDRFVIESVCRTLSQWKEQGYIGNISVNISAKTLESAGFMRWVVDKMESWHIEHGQIGFEIDEETLLNNHNMFVTLSECGVDLIVDRFSGNIANLAQFKKNDIRKVKYYGDY